ncbi:hypothetical protein OE699_06940 [Sedimentimonas flavescens]|uniref:Uncharacterized protein n=1 Tax=Sedimentimonas flavescens TaxID=2851012 RepID=A0ABT2ZXV7_9RHOB|nr:hypothetical protein [Sedimentimonas flavescens]MBW0157907.1 hypothetical protein [Sedimentimonas flavescens]MCT2540620.1 hypothetical protein [Sedimentimonas flavescens]MCV2878583.1 hypothetical protein [Sedimentimonas flavescens]WBL31774.1 hypothetical protein O5O51_08420 [Sinirhodobacter sp. HNIBRBA609]
MQLVLSHGYRSLSMIYDLAIDRVLPPLVIILALAAAGVIGVHLVEYFDAGAIPGRI